MLRHLNFELHNVLPWIASGSRRFNPYFFYYNFFFNSINFFHVYVIMNNFIKIFCHRHDEYVWPIYLTVRKFIVLMFDCLLKFCMLLYVINYIEIYKHGKIIPIMHIMCIIFYTWLKLLALWNANFFNKPPVTKQKIGEVSLT